MGKARYKTLVDAIATEINEGRLLPGARLPTHREFATKHGLALVTATRVFSELEAMGLVSGEVGRGTFVRDISLPSGHGIDQQDLVAAGTVDLNFNYPSLPGQTDTLRQALRQLASSGDLEAALRYQPHGGRPIERAAVARHLERSGLKVEGANVLIVNGAQHGLTVAVMALLKPGDVVAVDALTYPGFKVLAEVHRLELVPVPASSTGPDLDALERLCAKRRIRAIYAMPTMHNPLGWVTHIEWRERLVAIVRKHGLLIIEDAAYAFLANDPPPPLAALAPETTVYVSGLSKSVATGLRFGFASAPLKWIPAMERAIRATTWNTPGVITAMACGWLADGTVARLEEEKRQDAMLRQTIATEMLSGMSFVRHPSSYFLWLPLETEVRADLVAMALMREGISVSTSEPFATSSHSTQAIRLALGSVDIPKLRAALETVKRVIHHQLYL
ncbi:PLP-dependent aminotransferase family protein [Pandoraea apista]|uniref:aminotransferase-like domain-containing protein n=1 Tax=Pandoraea apista TaxID=93218 RepID=UPI0006596C3B|nr:PLP-dependent aminotransferase family protein [Pandoraea apista]ALS64854.1 GntR family transcriptional regulator [Pandoraea apista]RRW91847.1 PLP-dependent aminotransferase family protein [Pandoraea apista]RRX01224.1 PLP-dependent aminotransferase family protein [Pandoraea apista]CFB65157.1 putative HTH-type transcriptional regulator YjiR [Pandoraea apista]